ncbi:cation-translocating P-type ATPase [Celeribacter neptunius]|uniref:Ca2+-transporting ATPase n=1 Tax=Celeribacter neptunius TaxID=588602 RepID=A0A1I3L448_9RHOB|nr:cation-transporting P-type ATPase [Celeribacter neptunius]SFI79457.1 Ca2+-transporting ATPase [Celeribacter neptunius]
MTKVTEQIDPVLRYHAQSGDEILTRLGVTADKGLAEPEVAKRRSQFGPNRIASKQRVGLLTLLLRQLQSPVVFLLAGAAVLAALFHEAAETIAIVIVLLINTLIGFFTEYKAARSIEGLQALETPKARVRRDGHDRMIASEELVPGDIVLLDAGDAVPADLRLIETANLQVNESTLTGESLAVDKSAAPVAAEARLADRHSMLYRGTSLTAGSALGVVTGTGLATEIGQVSELVAEAGTESSPIEKKLAHLSSQLVWATLVLTVLIAGIGILSGKDAFMMAEAAIALAVAAIPEGLPVVATLTLARGMWRMARQNALVEHLSAVEALGATTVILTDKTGTLTENRMSVRRVWLPSGEVGLDGPLDGITTPGMATPGLTTQGMTTDDAARPGESDAQLATLIEVAVLCNDAALEDAEAEGTGDPMEVALLRAGLTVGHARDSLLQRYPLLRKVAFDSTSKMMATIHRRGEDALYAIKGAPEAVLRNSDFISPEGQLAALKEEDRQLWLARAAELARHGLRVLACAAKAESGPEPAPYEALTFLGLIGLEDPARSDVPNAIAACHRAGIRVVMVTGDHAATARSIGQSVGLESAAENVVEGVEVAKLTADGADNFARIGIFARVSPKEKLELVRAYQAAGEIVAMTGDGVNDAPALRQADIGVAMGLRGTDVARESSAMILLDDAFPTIVAAIREGRIIFGNIRRFAAYLLACNLTEVLVVGLAVLLSLPLPILPLQILYLNLITDVFPAFALALGEGESDVLERRPRPPQEPILGRPQWLRLGAQSLLMSAGVFGAMWLSPRLGITPEATVTVTFLTLATAQLWQVFNMHAGTAPLIRNEITRNPWVWAALALCMILLLIPSYLPPLGAVLGLVAPDATMWMVVLSMSLLPTLIWQVVMLVRRLLPAA